MMSSASSGNGGGGVEGEDAEEVAGGESAAEDVTESLVSSTAVAFGTTVPSPCSSSTRSTVLLGASASAACRVAPGAIPSREGRRPPLQVTLPLVPVFGCTGAGGCGITYGVSLVDAAAACVVVLSSVGWNVGANFALELPKQDCMHESISHGTGQEEMEDGLNKLHG